MSATEAYLREWMARVEQGRRVPPAFPYLADEERERFRTNCWIVEKTAAALEIRNFALYEIHVCRQWREEFESVESFAKSAQLSRSQLYKCMDQARVVFVFRSAGWGGATPSGRFVELLVKVPEYHWIAAWTHAQESCDQIGLSQVTVRDALRDYCRDRQIQFGRRQRDGSSETGLPGSFLVSDTRDGGIESGGGDESTNESHAEAREELRHAVSPEVLDRLRRAFARKRPEDVVLRAINTHLPSPRMDAVETDRHRVFLATLRENYPEAYERLVAAALAHSRPLVDRAVLGMADKNEAGRKNYARKKRNRPASRP